MGNGKTQGRFDNTTKSTDDVVRTNSSTEIQSSVSTPPPQHSGQCFSASGGRSKLRLTMHLDHLAKPTRHGSIESYLEYFRVGFGQCMAAKLTFLSYINLYTTLNDYLRCGVFRQLGPDGSVEAWRLYNELEKFLSGHLKPMQHDVAVLRDEDVLRYYADQWSNYEAGVRRLEHILKRFNESFLRLRRADGFKDVYEIYALGLVQWHQKLLRVMPKLSSSAIQWIMQRRHVQLEDNDPRQKVFHSLVSLASRPDLPRECLEFYKDHFELPFLTAMKEYYRALSRKSLVEVSVLDYTQKVQEWLRKDEDFAGCYLPMMTKKELIPMCENVLVREYGELMRHSCQALFKHQRIDELRCLYTFLARLPQALLPMQLSFEEHLGQMIRAANSKFETESRAGMIDIRLYVDTLAALYHENVEIAKCCSDGQANFSESLIKLLRPFINFNAATKTSKMTSTEFIGNYVDGLLRQRGSEDKVKKAIERVIILSKYVDDSEILQNCFVKKLSMRLVHGTSTSQDLEEFTVSKLREVHGAEHTNKLERLFDDIKKSEEFSVSFKTRYLSFNIKIFNAFSWPPEDDDNHFVVPRNFASTCTQFQELYREKQEGRKLKWLWAHSNHEMTTNYLNQKYTFVTSSYQAAILLLYNSRDTLSLSALLLGTGIPKDMLLRVLGLLQNARVLDKRGDLYTLNFGFKSKKTRVKLNYAIAIETKNESIMAVNIVQKDYNDALKAMIARIMKAKRTLDQQALIQEVFSRESQQFVPTIPDIKEAIQNLLDQDLIERAEDSRDTFNYVL